MRRAGMCASHCASTATNTSCQSQHHKAVLRTSSNGLYLPAASCGLHRAATHSIKAAGSPFTATEQNPTSASNSRALTHVCKQLVAVAAGGAHHKWQLVGTCGRVKWRHAVRITQVASPHASQASPAPAALPSRHLTSCPAQHTCPLRQRHALPASRRHKLPTCSQPLHPANSAGSQ